MFVPLAVSETARSFSAFPMKQNGNVKMNRRDQELLDKQMRRLTPPQNEGAIADACRDVFNWHHRRQPSVCAPK